MKIRNDQIQIGDKWTDIEVHYSTKRAIFTIKGLPSDFSIYSEIWRDGDCSESEAILLDRLRSAVYEYMNNNLSQRKVIVFSADASAHLIMNKSSKGQGEYIGFKHETYRKFTSCPFGSKKFSFGFDFNLMMEISRAGKLEYYGVILDDDYKETGELSKYKSSVEKSSTVIPYSQKAFEFFINMSISFEKLVANVSNLFCETDESKIISFIENQQYFLADNNQTDK
jgi:hypothetical protein